MFGNADPTAYDLRFELLGVPVRVHPFFWLSAVFLGWPDFREPDAMRLLLAWVMALFVHVMVHEFGHALVAKSYGWQPVVVLYVMGGYAQPTSMWNRSFGRMLLMLIAGPGAGFLLFFALLPLQLGYLGDNPWWEPNPAVLHFIEALQILNLYLGLFNLLPIFPLDGGQIARLLLGRWFPRGGHDWSLRISFLAAVVLGTLGYLHGDRWIAMMMAMFAVMNYQEMQQSNSRY